MAVNVLTSVSTSAPPSHAAAAVSQMSGTFGESLTISGLDGRASLQARVSSRRRRGSVPKVRPSLTLGHETLSSTPPTPWRSFIAPDDFDVIVRRVTGDVDDDGARHPVDLGQLFRQEAVEPNVGQSDRVEHPAAGLDDACGLVAGALVAGDALGDEAAERRQVHEVGVLRAIAAGAAARHGRVAQAQARKVGRQIDVRHACF